MRIRTIKPEFFLHEEIYEAEAAESLPLRLAFAGLWCASDREGRFKWEPRRLGIQILPYDQIDFARVLDALATRGFIRKYRAGDGVFGVIPSFLKHQVINNRERDSDIPEPTEYEDVDASITRDSHVSHASKAEGKGREQGKEGDRRERNKEHEEVVAFWNSFEKLPSIQAIGTSRMAAFKARLKEPYFRDNWRIAIEKIPTIPFLMGTNDRGWKADIDWLLKPESVGRIMEGKYSHEKKSTLTKTTLFDDSYERVSD